MKQREPVLYLTNASHNQRLVLGSIGGFSDTEQKKDLKKSMVSSSIAQTPRP
jgi:hypothetical protein